MLAELARRQCLDLLFISVDGGEQEVFAILDGATMKLLPDELEEHDEEYECLFRGETDPMVLTRAPYLVQLQRDAALTGWLLAEGWGQHWGMFALAEKGTVFEDVLDHLRNLLLACLPDERIVFFRFYDPRIWEPFLPTCSADQLAELFGPVRAYACESSDGKALMLDAVKDGAPQRVSHLLTP